MINFRVPVLAAVFSVTSFAATAQTADEIVQKHIVAIGGAENWKKINSIKINGVVKDEGSEFPVTITTVHKKGQRVEFTIDGKTGYEIITNTAGWSFNPMQGKTAQSMPPEIVKEAQEELDLQGPLIDYSAKGHKITYVGKGTSDGIPCYKLKVNMKNGREEIMYISVSDYYHVRTVEKIKEEGKEEDIVSTYSNYRKLPEGIMYPMAMNNDGGPVTIKSIEINKPVSENTFKP